MKSILSIALTNVRFAIIVESDESCVGEIVVQDRATGDTLTTQPIWETRPLSSYAETGEFERTLYVQSYNADNALSDTERAEIRDLIEHGCKGASWLVDNEAMIEDFASVTTTRHETETQGNITGGMRLEYLGTKLQSVTLVVGYPDLDINVEAKIDVSNGPVSFNATVSENTEFMDAIYKAAEHQIRA